MKKVTLFLVASVTSLTIFASYQNPDSLFRAGSALMKKWDHFGSYTACSQAFRLYQQQQDTFMMARTLGYMGVNLERLNRKRESDSCFMRAYHLYKAMDSATVNYASLLSKIGRYQESNHIFKQFSDKIHTNNWIGVNHRLMGNYDSAIYYHNRVIRVLPEHPWAYLSSGQAYEKKGEYRAAIKQYRSVLEFAESETVRYNAYTKIGNCYLAMNKPIKAKEALLAIPQTDQDNYAVVNANRELLAKAETQTQKLISELIILIIVITVLILLGVHTYHRKQMISNKHAIVGVRLRLEAMIQLLGFARDNICYNLKDEAIKDIIQAENLAKESKGQVH